MNDLKNQDMIITAEPTKRFFIDMLVRDIDLKPAIAELIDNSIDGAKKFRTETQYDGHCNIEINFDKSEFRIKDTCGGISIHDAKNYCFCFGRANERKSEVNKGVSVFGIGMKRALFRMGKEFEINSITPTERFSVNIDVDTWVAENDWTFSFSDIKKDEKNEFEICGTEIVIKRLHPTISNSFSDPYFQRSFIEYIKQRSSMIKELDISIRINDNDILYVDDKLLYSENFRPYVKIINQENVFIKIVAGCARLGEPNKAGWYVQCNGRTVLFANQGEETGWGTDGVRKFHPGFASFRGYVIFESDDLEKLPWNTTKTGVDLSSKFYKQALYTMIECEKRYIKWINEKDSFIDDTLNQMEDNFSLTDKKEKNQEVFSGKEIEVFSQLLKVETHKESDFMFPDFKIFRFNEPKEILKTISYKVTQEKIEKIKYCLNKPKISNKEIGERTFNYFYEREIEDEE